VVIQNLNTGFGILSLLGAINGTSEQGAEPLQRVLIHWVDDSQVYNCEEENLSSESDWSESGTSPINLSLSSNGFLHTESNLVTSDLSLSKHINKLVVLKNLDNLRVLGKTL